MIHSGKKRIIGAWLLVFLLVAMHLFVRSAHASEAKVWKQIYARTGDCRIAFPSVPKMIQQALTLSDEGDKLTYDVYLAPLNEKALCLLLVAVYPFPLKDGHELTRIEGLLNGIVSHHPDNKLVFGRVIDQQGEPAVDFLVQSPSSYFRARALMKGRKLYLIAIDGRQGEIEEEAFTKFVQSFALVP